MCLITINTTETKFTEAWLLDFFSYNEDGLGVMYSENNELVIEKFVPKNKAQALEFYSTHVEGKNAVVHWRMRTHGATDMANAHPYEVLNKEEHGIDLWMMHNGILSGVANDQPHMSDTWHFIRDTMRPLLASFPELLNTPAFIELIEENIGSSNKLVFMDTFGNTTVINEAAFHEFSGAKLSNTYAWSSWSRDNLETPEKEVQAYKHNYSKSSYAPTISAYNRYEGSFYDAEDEAAYKSMEEEYATLEQIVWDNPVAVASLLDDYGITAHDVQLYCNQEVAA